MKNSYLSILFIAILLFNFSSCQEEENVSFKEKHLKNEFVNPYDYCGYHHNQMLDEIIQEGINIGGSLNEEETVDWIVTYSIEHLGLVQEDAEKRKAYLLAIDHTGEKPSYLSEHETLSGYYDEMNSIFINYENTENFDALHAQIKDIEISAYGNTNLNEEEKSIVLGACAVAHHSTAFWSAPRWKWENDAKKTGSGGPISIMMSDWRGFWNRGNFSARIDRATFMSERAAHESNKVFIGNWQIEK